MSRQGNLFRVRWWAVSGMLVSCTPTSGSCGLHVPLRWVHKTAQRWLLRRSMMGILKGHLTRLATAPVSPPRGKSGLEGWALASRSRSPKLRVRVSPPVERSTRDSPTLPVIHTLEEVPFRQTRTYRRTPLELEGLHSPPYYYFYRLSPKNGNLSRLSDLANCTI